MSSSVLRTTKMEMLRMTQQTLTVYTDYRFDIDKTASQSWIHEEDIYKEMTLRIWRVEESIYMRYWWEEIREDVDGREVCNSSQCTEETDRFGSLSDVEDIDEVD
eukprot:GHVS01026273.1.p1 GENE.GHVS01026273.1~~GHVS01026273.1.p1  ORF type:complete len:105 (+),score=16.24 GHVS01026273.1:141-455(+)